MERNHPKKRGQGIVRMSDLFKKYTDVLRAPQGTVTQAFVDVVEEILGASIKKESCTYSVASKTLVVRAPGMIKSEIQLQKKKIIARMAEKLGPKNIPIEIL